MEQPLIPAGLEQLLQFAILLFVVVGFFRQFATQRDIKALSDRIGSVETRLGNVEMRLGNVETRLGNVETRLDNVEIRLDRVETRLGNVETRLGNVETRLDRLEDSVREIGKKADASLDLHNAVQIDLKVLQASVERLESYFETPKLKSS